MFEIGQNIYNLKTNKLGTIIEKINDNTYNIEYFYDNSPKTFIEKTEKINFAISNIDLVKICFENLEIKENTNIENGLLLFYFDLENYGFGKKEDGYIDDFNMFGCKNHIMKEVCFSYDIFTKALLPFANIKTNNGIIKRHLSQEEIEEIESYLDFFCNNQFSINLVDKAVELSKDNKPYT